MIQKHIENKVERFSTELERKLIVQQHLTSNTRVTVKYRIKQVSSVLRSRSPQDNYIQLLYQCFYYYHYHLRYQPFCR